MQSKALLPRLSADPQTDEEKAVRERYDRIKGSAVNPVLREGNSDRRAPKAVKTLQKHPHSMGAWTKDSKTHVATMQAATFSITNNPLPYLEATSVSVVFTDKQGNKKSCAAEPVALKAGEIIDATVMNKSPARLPCRASKRRKSKRRIVLAAI